MTLVFASFKDFKLFQIDVKSAFLNSFIKEDVYIEQPLGFVNSTHPNFIFKLDKALYSLKRALRAWYERLSCFLVSSGFVKGKIDTTLGTKYVDNDILIV